MVPFGYVTRPEIFGVDLAKLHALGGSDDEDALERAMKRLEGFSKENWYAEASAIVRRIVFEGFPFAELDIERMPHVAAVVSLVQANLPLDDMKASFWNVSPIYGLASVFPDIGGLFRVLIAGRPLLGKEIKTEWSYYGYLTYAEVRELRDVLASTRRRIEAQPPVVMPSPEVQAEVRAALKAAAGTVEDDAALRPLFERICVEGLDLGERAAKDSGRRRRDKAGLVAHRVRRRSPRSPGVLCEVHPPPHQATRPNPPSLRRGVGRMAGCDRVVDERSLLLYGMTEARADAIPRSRPIDCGRPSALRSRALGTRARASPSSVRASPGSARASQLSRAFGTRARASASSARASSGVPWGLRPALARHPYLRGRHAGIDDDPQEHWPITARGDKPDRSTALPRFTHRIAYRNARAAHALVAGAALRLADFGWHGGLGDWHAGWWPRRAAKRCPKIAPATPSRTT